MDFKIVRSFLVRWAARPQLLDFGRCAHVALVAFRRMEAGIEGVKVEVVWAYALANRQPALWCLVHRSTFLENGLVGKLEVNATAPKAESLHDAEQLVRHESCVIPSLARKHSVAGDDDIRIEVGVDRMRVERTAYSALDAKEEVLLRLHE